MADEAMLNIVHKKNKSNNVRVRDIFYMLKKSVHTKESWDLCYANDRQLLISRGRSPIQRFLWGGGGGGNWDGISEPVRMHSLKAQPK